MGFFKKYKGGILWALGIIALLAVFSYISWPYVQSLQNPEVQAALQAKLNEFGVWGYLIMFLIQFVQVVVVVLPGEFIEIFAGVLYGGLGGLAICLIGCLAASSFIFWTSKNVLGDYLRKQLKMDEVKTFSFLKDTKRAELVVLVLFLIPGTPKDVLTYLGPMSNMRLLDFVLLSNFARIPSIVTSTYVGENLSRGDWRTSLLIFLITGVVGVIGILTKDKIISHLRKREQLQA